MSRANVEYYGTCEHLHSYGIKSDKCFKRKFELFDYKRGITRNILVCNDYLKMVFTDYPKRNEYTINANQVYSDIVTDILKKEYRVVQYKFSYDMFDVPVMMCNDPIKLYVIMDVSEALKLYFSMDHSRNISYDVKDELSISIEGSIIKIINYTLKFMKYKKYWEQGRRLKEEIKRGIIYLNEEIMLTDYLVDVLKVIPNKAY